MDFIVITDLQKIKRSRGPLLYREQATAAAAVATGRLRTRLYAIRMQRAAAGFAAAFALTSSITLPSPDAEGSLREAHFPLLHNFFAKQQEGEKKVPKSLADRELRVEPTAVATPRVHTGAPVAVVQLTFTREQVAVEVCPQRNRIIERS
jgi:hypothetical protein